MYFLYFPIRNELLKQNEEKEGTGEIVSQKKILEEQILF